MMDNNRERCCRAIAIWMLAIQSTEGASVEWPASMRSHSRKHLAPIPAMRQPVAATALLSHDQCRSAQKTDIRSEIIVYNLNVRKIFVEFKDREPQRAIEPAAERSLRNISTAA